MSDQPEIIVGVRNSWGGEAPFGLSREDRRRHVYCIGQTGAGKTTLLRNLILQDIEAGRGGGVIDPHGDLASDLIDHIPRRRADDLVYFNPADFEHPVGFNLIERVERDRRPLVASSVVSVFKSIWREIAGDLGVRGSNISSTTPSPRCSTARTSRCSDFSASSSMTTTAGG